ncbi:unnamed protein product [Zymoseptoria tritici ST99CH_1E4]|uniref:F-box domain-containing protein n=1 Tax=Zymoseptoria tritici ST99CH_1E4 TaxID=1276532 RepID=A0A2H1GCR9_ZYMTR|nr:unnamed protein product [Zymoseptoria tritici ST99CH_1E4]
MEDKESSEHPTLHELSPIPLPPAQPFRLMDLPDELWVRIGKMVIEDSAAIEVRHIEWDRNLVVPLKDRHHQRPDGWVYSSELTPPAILQTCAALRKELRAEYYRAKITISVTRRPMFGSSARRRPAIGQYLRMIGPDARKMIQATHAGFMVNKTQEKVGEPPAQTFSDWEVEMMWTSVREPYWHQDLDMVEWQVKFL